MGAGPFMLENGIQMAAMTTTCGLRPMTVRSCTCIPHIFHRTIKLNRNVRKSIFLPAGNHDQISNFEKQSYGNVGNVNFLLDYADNTLMFTFDAAISGRIICFTAPKPDDEDRSATTEKNEPHRWWDADCCNGNHVHRSRNWILCAFAPRGTLDGRRAPSSDNYRRESFRLHVGQRPYHGCRRTHRTCTSPAQSWL